MFQCRKIFIPVNKSICCLCSFSVLSVYTNILLTCFVMFYFVQFSVLDRSFTLLHLSYFKITCNFFLMYTTILYFNSFKLEIVCPMFFFNNVITVLQFDLICLFSLLKHSHNTARLYTRIIIHVWSSVFSNNA